MLQLQIKVHIAVLPQEALRAQVVVKKVFLEALQEHPQLAAMEVK